LHGLLLPDEEPVVQELLVLRNQAVHSPDSITSTDALRYYDFAEALIANVRERVEQVKAHANARRADLHNCSGAAQFDQRLRPISPTGRRRVVERLTNGLARVLHLVACRSRRAGELPHGDAGTDALTSTSRRVCSRSRPRDPKIGRRRPLLKPLAHRGN
jgi:hypothetical protein